MTTKAENDALRKQIYETMNFKETEELLAIWRKGDHEEWTDLALDVVKELLLERLGEIPPEEKEQVIVPDVQIYSPKKGNKLGKIGSFANLLSWFVVSLYSALFIMRAYLVVYNTISAHFIRIQQIYDLVGLLSTPISGLIYFVILQAISKGINAFLERDKDNPPATNGRK